MKVLLDTNVLLDVALERLPFFADSDRILHTFQMTTTFLLS